MNPRRRLCLIGLGMLILAVLIAVTTGFPAWKWYQLVLLRDEGGSAQAVITKTDIDISGRRPRDVIYYEYQPAAGGPRCTGVLRLSGRGDPFAAVRFNQQSNQGTLFVRYRTDDPKVHCLAELLPERIAWARFETLGYLGLAGVLGLAGLGLSLWGLPAWRSKRRTRARL